MMTRFLKNKKGMTLVELIVSMGIFSVVMTVTVSFFIAIQNMQTIYRDRANLQQEGRIAAEIFSRYVREAQSVAMTDGAGNPVSELNNGAGLCVGGNATLDLVMSDSTTLKFKCDGGTPNRLQMSSCSPPDGDCYSDVSSGQINVSSFRLWRGTPATFPKTLRYNMEVDQFKSGIIGEGEKVMFPGYLVMRNEL